ncbi:hypothetical protein [Mucilaginibacter gilvus]|uniref:Uncharacterized protein n=1 Tax=Mucilaginibacter gilvus TaxID=2305909 RepID=A0A444MTQ8_9SPHI|nr:hypothetical protein [Mucilaginibacter gilvus]RWY57043.1 hypothetical protein EPL05_00480 [Mucilaginibacter gilvus]
MEKLFKIRIDSVEFDSNQVDLIVSRIGKNEIDELALSKLKIQGLTSDPRNFNYSISGKDLYVEGWASQIQKSATAEFIM